MLGFFYVYLHKYERLRFIQERLPPCLGHRPVQSNFGANQKIMEMDIPVTFQFRNQQITGSLLEVAGSGSNTVWHLMVSNYYWGRLRLHDDEFVFDPTPATKEVQLLVDYFGAVAIGWYQ